MSLCIYAGGGGGIQRERRRRYFFPIFEVPSENSEYILKKLDR